VKKKAEGRWSTSVKMEAVEEKNKEVTALGRALPLRRTEQLPRRGNRHGVTLLNGMANVPTIAPTTAPCRRPTVGPDSLLVPLSLRFKVACSPGTRGLLSV
jgi:hypothetical protein